MSKPTRPPVPSERTETVREAIRRVLGEGPATAKELSRFVGIREKDVEAHLEHLEKSLKRDGLKLKVEPASCRSCGFVFDKRRRLSRPGACPECRQTHIEPPVFQVVDAGAGGGQ